MLRASLLGLLLAAFLIISPAAVGAGPVVENSGLREPVLAYLVQTAPRSADGTIELEAAFEAGYDLEALRVRVIGAEGVEILGESPRFQGRLTAGESHARRFRVRVAAGNQDLLPASISLFVEYRFPFEPILQSLMTSPLGRRGGPERQSALDWARSLQGHTLRDVHALALP